MMDLMKFSEGVILKETNHFFELNEGRYPLWVRLVVGGMVMKIKNLENQIQSETDVQKQNKLISKQNSLVSYISGLGVGVSSTDPILLKRLKSMSSGKRN